MGQAISGLVFMPPAYDPAAVIPVPLIKLRTRRQQVISAFYLNKQAPLTILFSHGNAEDLPYIFSGMHELFEHVDANVFCYEYTGYFDNHSPPTEEDCYADIDAAYAYVISQLSKDPQTIVLYGRSLGSGPTCYLAERLSTKGCVPAGVILQSPLASAYRVAVPNLITLPGDMFPNIDRIPHIHCPVFIIHGENDFIVPFSHGMELHRACNRRWQTEPLWVKEASHNDVELVLWEEDGRLFKEIRVRLAAWLRQSRWPSCGDVPTIVGPTA